MTSPETELQHASFLPAADVLWGRSDFMSVFGLVIQEDRKELALILPPGVQAP
jgi:hypothetical protein